MKLSNLTQSGASHNFIPNIGTDRLRVEDRLPKHGSVARPAVVLVNNRISQYFRNPDYFHKKFFLVL